MNERKQRLTALDGVKGLACVMIYLFHNSQHINDGHSLFTYGYLYVEVFMALSGFVIEYNYGNKIRDLKLADFFLPRYFRLMPMLWLTDIILISHALTKKVILGSTTLLGKDFSIIRFFVNLTGLTGWSEKFGLPRNLPLWTLSCLLYCYIVFWLINKYVSSQKKRLFLWGSIFVVMGFLYLVLFPKIGISDCVGLLRCVTAFAEGVIICFVYENIKREQGQWLMVLWSVLFCLNFVLELLQIHWIGGYEFSLFILSPFLIFTAIYSFLIRKVWNSHVFTWLGSVSMSLYMWHAVVPIIISNRFLDQFYEVYGDNVRFFINTALVMATVVLSHCYVEPMLNKFTYYIVKKINSREFNNVK